MRRFLLGPGKWLILLVVVGGGVFFLRDRLSGGAQDLAVGDCFDVPAAATISEVQHRPCGEPHDGEVILVGTYPADDATAYPAEAAFGAWVTANCVTAFAAYTGMPYDATGAIQLRYFSPTRDGWSERRDRQLTCFMAPPAADARWTRSWRAVVPSK